MTGYTIGNIHNSFPDQGVLTDVHSHPDNVLPEPGLPNLPIMTKGKFLAKDGYVSTSPYASLEQ